MSTKFLISLAILSVTLSLESIWGLPLDLTLATLITCALFLNLGELFLLSLWSFWFLNWQPIWGIEFFLYLGIPLLVWLWRSTIRTTLWLANLIFIPLGISVFYFAIDYANAEKMLPLFLANGLMCAALGALIFKLLAYYDTTHGRRLSLSERF